MQLLATSMDVRQHKRVFKKKMLPYKFFFTNNIKEYLKKRCYRTNFFLQKWSEEN